MPYTIEIVLFDDLGNFYKTAVPPFSGMVTAFSPPFIPDTVVTTPPASTTLMFPLPTTPPSGNCTVLALDMGTAGDIFRSGIVSSLPPSPGTLTVITVPTIDVTFAALEASITGGKPLVTGMPLAATLLAALFSGGTFIPVGLTITDAVSSTSLEVTVTGTLTATVFWFFTRTYGFTLTFTAVPAPSGDAIDRSRVLKVTTTNATMITTPLPSFLLFVLSPAIASLAAPLIEDAMNSRIASEAADRLRDFGHLMSPTAVICARKAEVNSLGLVLQLTFSDLFGPAVIPLPPPPHNFAVAVMPQPKAGSQQAYTITVTDIATGAVVPQANVTLHNFGVNGNPITVGLGKTDSNGHVPFNGTLHPKIMTQIITGNRTGPVHEHERLFVSPTLTVELEGFNTFTKILLEDDGGP